MFKLPILLLVTLLPAFSSYSAPQPVVDNKLIDYVNSNHQQQLATLWQQNELLRSQLDTAVFMQELSRGDHNFTHKQDWDDLQQLSIRAKFLMENNIATFDEYEAYLQFLQAKINNSVWEKCLQSLNCDFSKVKLGLQSKELKALNHSALEVKETREQLYELQKQLLSITTESQSAEGYAELLDALLKISQTSAQSLALLSKQLNTLLTLKLNEMSASRLEKQTEQAIEERFVKIGTPASSVRHFDLKVSPYVK